MLLLGLAYCRGVEAGKSDLALKLNQAEIIVRDSVTRADSTRADSARRETDKVEAVYRGVRDKVRVVHDTVWVEDEFVVEDVIIATLIRVADSTIAAQKESLRLQDILIASLRQGIELRNVRIDILEKKKSPLLGFRSGLVVGASLVVGALVLAR